MSFTIHCLGEVFLIKSVMSFNDVLYKSLSGKVFVIKSMMPFINHCPGKVFLIKSLISFINHCLGKVFLIKSMISFIDHCPGKVFLMKVAHIGPWAPLRAVGRDDGSHSTTGPPPSL